MCCSSREEGQKTTWFQKFKEYPPAASISSIKNYLEQYKRLINVSFDLVDISFLGTSLSRDLFKQAKYYSADSIKRFKIEKRNTIILVFLSETRKILLDYLAQMHERYIADICRQCSNIHLSQLKQYQNKHDKALDHIIKVVDYLLEQASKESIDLDLDSLFQSTHSIDELSQSRDNMKKYQIFLKYGYSNLLQNRYQSMRRYFSDYIQLVDFKAPNEDSSLIEAIEIIKKLDNKELKSLPTNVPYDFINKDLKRALFDQDSNIKRNIWEMGVAIAIKESLVSGNIYIPQSKQYISFRNLVYSDKEWAIVKNSSYESLKLESKASKAAISLKEQFLSTIHAARINYKKDDFAEIKNEKLKLRKKDALEESPEVVRLQKILSSSLPKIKIEQLLIEVDQITGFSRNFMPIHKQKSQPANFYKTLMASLLSQATNIGISAMQDCTINITSDMIRYVMDSYIREDTIKLANADLVNQHSILPFSNIHGGGNISSSDGQRFAVTASSLMSSFCPRYFGYYEKAIGIYTHVSDQYSVFNTKVISCSPREALYVLDGLLENNTILENREHTTDTEGFTEHIFALSFLLGYQFVPRIKNLKDQQLYCVNKDIDYGQFNSILNKTIDINLIEEQWDEMIRVIASLRSRLTPAHEIVRRLSKGTDRLSKAFTHLGRLLKTQHILRYITDEDLRNRIYRQLNKGEYRHTLPRWIFFANQGKFQTGDYEEIMNKASCLSLISNAVLYWNTVKMSEIVDQLRRDGEKISDETLSHISLLPHKHVIPMGTYFVDGVIEMAGLEKVALK